MKWSWRIIQVNNTRSSWTTNILIGTADKIQLLPTRAYRLGDETHSVQLEAHVNTSKLFCSPLPCFICDIFIADRFEYC